MKKETINEKVIEFLQLYGWAIVAAIIILAIFAYFYSMDDEQIYNYGCLGESFCRDVGLVKDKSSDIAGKVICRYYIFGEDIPIYQRIEYEVDFDYLKIKYPECVVL